MTDSWLLAPTAVAVIALGLYLTARRPRNTVEDPGPRDEREERLAHRLARAVGCSPTQARPAVRREIAASPAAADDTVLKRAAYHYRRNLPDGPCPVYRDRAVG